MHGPSRYYVLASRKPSTRDVALDRDLRVTADRVEHARGVAAVASLGDVVDPVFGPPAYPFDVLVVDRPASVRTPAGGQHGEVAADSWHVVEVIDSARVFGGNGRDVVAVLEALQTPRRYSLTRAEQLATALLGSLSLAAPVMPSVADVAWGWRTQLLDRARDAGLHGEADHAFAAVRSTCWDRVVANVPRGGRGAVDWDAVSDLMGCAAVWACIHGARANPFTPAVELARMNAFPAAEGAALTCWRRGEPVVRLEAEPGGGGAAAERLRTGDGPSMRLAERPALAY